MSAQFIYDLVDVNKTTLGREKIFRTAQYFCRFYGWVLSDGGKPLAKTHPVKALEDHLSIARKLLRLFKSIDHFLDAQKGYLSPAADSEFDKTLRVLNDVCKSLRMVFDHVQWAGSVGLLGANGKSISDRAGRLANICWLFGLLISLTHGFRKRVRLLHQLKSLKRSNGAEMQDEREALEKQRQDLRRQLRLLIIDMLREICDLPVPAHGLSLIPAQTTGLVGLSGTVSSLIGLWQAWTAVTARKAAQKSK
eukprot:m.33738 g.33738  ORF g.33738 m.33738 type:complete len:251 (+) comp10922_c0_seq4:70-822(+)